MDRCAVLIDAGYLLAQAATVLGSKSSTPRRDAVLDTKACSEELRTLAEEITGLPILRIYWYDGVNHKGPTAEHSALALEQDIKLRLGSVRSDGRQKGVDPLLVLDLIELAHHQACSDVVLFTGDADIVPGIEKAQSYGVRAHLVCSTPVERSVSSFVREAVDTVTELNAADFLRFCTLKTKPDELDYPVNGFLLGHDDDWDTPSDSEPEESECDQELEEGLRHTAQLHWESVDASRQKHLALAVKSGSGVPPEHDGRLLARARASLARELTGNERRILRESLRLIALGES